MDTHILRSQVPSLLEVLAKMILTGMIVWVLEPYVLSGLLAFPRPLPILGEHTYVYGVHVPTPGLHSFASCTVSLLIDVCN